MQRSSRAAPPWNSQSRTEKREVPSKGEPCTLGRSQQVQRKDTAVLTSGTFATVRQLPSCEEGGRREGGGVGQRSHVALVFQTIKKNRKKTLVGSSPGLGVSVCGGPEVKTNLFFLSRARTHQSAKSCQVTRPTNYHVASSDRKDDDPAKEPVLKTLPPCSVLGSAPVGRRVLKTALHNQNTLKRRGTT